MEEAYRAVEDLNSSRQSLWTALRLSISQRFMYFLQLSPPSLAEPVADWLDTQLWRLLENTCGFSIPREQEGGGLRIEMPVNGLNNQTFQEWVIRLPVRLYGWGFRRLRDICGPAYIGALETAIPYMAGRGVELAPQLAEVWGGEERWGEDAPTQTRWLTVFESGCSEGREVQSVWRKITAESSALHTWLELGRDGPSWCTCRGNWRWICNWSEQGPDN